MYGPPPIQLNCSVPFTSAGEQVVQVEAERLRELADRGVALVDELAAVLGDLTGGEVAAARPAAPTHPGARLVHRHLHAGRHELVRAREPGEPRTDDDDPRRSGAGGQRAHRRGNGRRGGAQRGSRAG